MTPTPTPTRWQFWIDRGGTFTDVVALDPQGRLRTHKLLSENPGQYRDAALAGIRHLLGLAADAPITPDRVACVKMGTTVATNALLERQGEPTLLVITQGFGDALRIAYQNRPRLFDREIVLPERLYAAVVEARERVGAQGERVQVLDEAHLQAALAAAHAQGLRSVAIVFMHGWRYPAHELAAARLARAAGFTQVSVSHQVSPLMKLVARGDTTVVDAYLSPILRRYVDRVAAEMPGVPLFFMQSSGALADARAFAGKDAILSGPAGGIVGMARTAELALAEAGVPVRVIGFDMGGTSTDVSHYAGEFERAFETQVAGVRMRAPMMGIHTVAAGGGSLLRFDGTRCRVGPQSAGADPGPACYRRGGPLAVTDANVLLGRLQPAHFPAVFGPGGDQPLDAEATRRGFAALAAQTGQSPEDCAEGFVRIAVQQMAGAIKKISVARGHDVTGYTLQCFGGAGGQHACAVADALGMGRVLVHPLAGVLSAYGMGLADQAVLREQALELPLAAEHLPTLAHTLQALGQAARAALAAQALLPEAQEAQEAQEGREGVGHGQSPAAGQASPAAPVAGPAAASPVAPVADRVALRARLHVRYQGTDTALVLACPSLDGAPEAVLAAVRTAFEAAYRQRFAFLMAGKPLVLEAVSVEAVAPGAAPPEPRQALQPPRELPVHETVRLYHGGAWHAAALLRREALRPGDVLAGPAIVAEANATTVVEPGWRARVSALDHLWLERVAPRAEAVAPGPAHSAGVDPVRLEVFNHLFMNIAEQMGLQLQNTAHSVNIKERLDFSCALFDAQGQLIANAPHMPVHLGSMGESIRTVMADHAGRMAPGDVYVLNDPYHGGTHLPDVTVITPVFLDGEATPCFYVGSRGHHADIGGSTPGSMPPFSTRIEEEGVRIRDFTLVDAGVLREAELLALLSGRGAAVQEAAGMGAVAGPPAGGAAPSAAREGTPVPGAGPTLTPHPSRNPAQNLADLKAQMAANATGAQELRKMVAQFGADVVQAYMGHVQDNAEAAVRRAIGALAARLRHGRFTLPLDNGAQVCVAVRIDAATCSAEIDFSGTSPQQPNNFNAPTAVSTAAVLYVFRTLVDDDIPLNAGCLKPLRLFIPEGCLLNPRPPAAVVAGNVETSTAITHALYGALGVMASGQPTMNNFTFGNARHQYYETIAGGSGAGGRFDAQGRLVGGFDGTAVVQTHMTNSRLTDPEVLEWRFPVRLESYALRPGSGGGGRWRGGDGGVRRVRFLEAMTAGILSNGRVFPAFGLAGAQPGAPGLNRVCRADGRVEVLGHLAEVAMAPGDVFEVHTPGGGGFGEIGLQPLPDGPEVL